MFVFVSTKTHQSNLKFVSLAHPAATTTHARHGLHRHKAHGPCPGAGVLGGITAGNLEAGGGPAHDALGLYILNKTVPENIQRSKHFVAFPKTTVEHLRARLWTTVGPAGTVLKHWGIPTTRESHSPVFQSTVTLAETPN